MVGVNQCCVYRVATVRQQISTSGTSILAYILQIELTWPHTKF